MVYWIKMGVDIYTYYQIGRGIFFRQITKKKTRKLENSYRPIYYFWHTSLKIIITLLCKKIALGKKLRGVFLDFYNKAPLVVLDAFIHFFFKCIQIFNWTKSS